MTELLRISNSEIQSWKSCRRKWYLSYYRELGLSKVEMGPVGARQLGTKVHIALCALYESHANPVDVINDLYAEDIEVFKDAGMGDKIDDLKKEQDLAKAMVEGYTEWIAETGADEGIELDAAETVIEVPMPGVEGVVLRGKLDQRVVRKTDGARLFLDHKTVGDLLTPQRLLPLDEQMKFYHLLEKLDSLHKTGDEPPWRTDGGLYNMLRKVKRTAAAKPPFYGRAEIHHNDTALRTMFVRVSRVVMEILDARQALDAEKPSSDPDYIPTHHYVVPPRPSRDCTWSCDFFAVCPMFDDGSNVEGLLDEYFVHVDPHERYAIEEGKGVSE